MYFFFLLSLGELEVGRREGRGLGVERGRNAYFLELWLRLWHCGCVMLFLFCFWGKR